MAVNIPEIGKKRVVIVGAGFAGLKLSRKLCNHNFQVVLIDKNNYHQFQPLFYQVAMSGLEPSSISFPLRKAFQRVKDVSIRVTEVTEILTEEKRLLTPLGHVNYDILVLAYGTVTNFFNNDSFKSYSYPLKTVSQALFIRNQILSDLESAVITREYESRQSLLDIVIVGGGPTGVEMAGSLAEMKNYILPKDYKELNSTEVDIYLIQSANRLLPGMTEFASKNARESLEKLGVHVKTGCRVIDIDDEYVYTNDNSKIRAGKIIWAAGVKCPKLGGLKEESYGPANRLLVKPNLELVDYEDIYAIGDLAFLTDDIYKKGHPQVAQVAIQQARLLSKNLIKGKKEPFIYKDLGSMATIGRNKAVVELPKLKFKGFFAWLVWLFVHITSLIGIRNKIVVILNWFWSYITYDQSLRLIIKPYSQPKKKVPKNNL